MVLHLYTNCLIYNAETKKRVENVTQMEFMELLVCELNAKGAFKCFATLGTD